MAASRGLLRIQIRTKTGGLSAAVCLNERDEGEAVGGPHTRMCVCVSACMLV